MNSLFIIKSSNSNFYLFNARKQQLIYCNPLLIRILHIWEKSKGKVSLDDLFQEIRDVDKDQISFYFGKFRHLLENRFIEQCIIENKIESKIPPRMIEKQLANSSQVTFEVTESCNLNCTYCAYGEIYSDYDERTGSTLDVNAAKNLIKFLQKTWNSSLNESQNSPISFDFYGGEPLLNFKFIKNIVEFVKRTELIHNKYAFVTKRTR